MWKMLLLGGLVVVLAIPATAEIQPQYLNSFQVTGDPDLARLADIPILTWEWASGRSILAEAPNAVGAGQMNREHILLASGGPLKFTPPSKTIVGGQAPAGVLRLTKTWDASSVAIMSRCTGNRRIPGMKLALCSLGPSGAGKTTLITLVLKDIAITSYRVWGAGAGPRKGLLGVAPNQPIEQLSLAYGGLQVLLE